MRYGFFDQEHREYVVERVDTPVSWTNYIGTKDMCGVFNQTAGGYLFRGSSEYHRMTRFRPNGVPMDFPGHYIYLRDEADGDYWSASWQPVGKPFDQAKYICRHGLSYSKYLSDYRGIHAEETLFVAQDDPVEIWNVTVRNDSNRTRKLSVFSYCEFSFHQIDMDNRNFQMSLYAAGSRCADGIIEHDLYYEEDGYQFFTSNFDPDGYDCLRDSFIGPYRSERNPHAPAVRSSAVTIAERCKSALRLRRAKVFGSFFCLATAELRQAARCGPDMQVRRRWMSSLKNFTGSGMISLSGCKSKHRTRG